jgi:hypothetical protein
MRQRTAKLASNSTRQPPSGNQMTPQQIQPPNYGRGISDYSQGGHQTNWQQPVYQQPLQTPPRQYQQKGQLSSQPQVEQLDGPPEVIQYGKIQIKHAITLITLRLAKMEEMLSTPNFHSVMNGTIGGGDAEGDDISSELIESINERLGGLENNVGLLFERTTDLHTQLEVIKTSIQTIIDGTSIDQEDLIVKTTQFHDDTPDIFTNEITQSTTTIIDSIQNDDDNEEK